MKINRTIRHIFCTAASIVVAFCSLTLVFADTPSGFGVAAILPENQIDTNLSYFDLRMQPGMEQTLQLAVSNTENQAILAMLSLNTAGTAQNGTILYDEVTTPDKSMQVELSSLASIENPEIRLEPGETKNFNITLKMPEKEIDGVLLGGLVVTTAYPENEAPKEEVSGNLAVENEFKQIIGLKVTMNDTVAKPNFEFISAEAGMTNYRPDIKVKVRNASPIIVKGMVVKVDVAKKGSSKILYSSAVEDADMAPLSAGDFLVSLDGNEMEAGDYTTHVSLNWQDETWEWDEDFTIEGAQAEEINNESVAEVAPKTGLPTWVYIALAAGGIVIAFLLAVIVKSRKKQA